MYERPEVLPMSVDTDELTVADARLYVARSVGRKQSGSSPLTKRTLNSIHRYLTGEFAYPPKHRNTARSPSKAALRSQVIVALERAGCDEFAEADGGRPFRRDELRALARALDGIEPVGPY